MTDRDDGLDEFQLHRRRMFAIAYRMLGSATEADDVLQDAWLRWHAVDRTGVRNPEAFLARTITNLCLTALDSARARREVYVGPWFAEPVLTSAANTAGPLVAVDDLEQRDTISIALLGLLERLSGPERATYVLREAFAYEYSEIAQILDTSESNARQIHSRARRRVAQEPVRRADPTSWRELVEQFLVAARSGDVAALEALLADGAVSRVDGGGIVNAARLPVVGRQKLAYYLLSVIEKFGAGLTPDLVEVNGELALIATLGLEVRAVWFIDVRDDEIQDFAMIVNPRKLDFIERQLSQIGGVSSLS